MQASDSKSQILIVDRDVATMEPLRLGLAVVGFVVRAITDKAAAIECLAERPPHLVILEWNLPRFGGLELIEAARASNPPQGTGLIIVSSLSTEHDIIEGLSVGADDYIAKPYSPPEVVARVRAVLRTRARRARIGRHEK